MRYFDSREMQRIGYEKEVSTLSGAGRDGPWLNNDDS